MKSGNKKTMIKWLEDQEDGFFKTKRSRKRRSLNQNSYMHVIFQYIHDYINDLYGFEKLTEKQVKEMLKDSFLDKVEFEIDGNIKYIPRSTSDLNTLEIKNFIDKIDDWFFDLSGERIPNSEDKSLLVWCDENYF